MSDQEIKQRVQEQFGATAQSYVTSPGHAHGDDLARMLELASPRGPEHMLDIATGGGHTAPAFAPDVQSVVASDLTPAMLAAAEAFIRGRGAANVRFERADAEALPFADASFDLVTTRIAPHHFPNPARYVAEVARVLRPGGRFVLNDNMAPEDDELSAFIDRAEQWRDPSHVCNYRPSAWRGWIRPLACASSMSSRCRPSATTSPTGPRACACPAPEQAALEQWLIAAPARCRQYFDVRMRAARALARRHLRHGRGREVRDIASSLRAPRTRRAENSRHTRGEPARNEAV